MVFGARADWGGVTALHVAPVSGSDVEAAFVGLGLAEDLWEIGPRHGERTKVEARAMRRRRAVQLVHRAPPDDACLIGDPSAAVQGALGVALASDRHATLYARDPVVLARALAIVLGRRLRLQGDAPVASLVPLVRATDDAWVDSRAHRSERLAVVRFRDVQTGDEVERWVRSRTIAWRAGFAW